MGVHVACDAGRRVAETSRHAYDGPPRSKAAMSPAYGGVRESTAAFPWLRRTRVPRRTGQPAGKTLRVDGLPRKRADALKFRRRTASSKPGCSDSGGCPALEAKRLFSLPCAQTSHGFTIDRNAALPSLRFRRFQLLGWPFGLVRPVYLRKALHHVYAAAFEIDVPPRKPQHLPTPRSRRHPEANDHGERAFLHAVEDAQHAADSAGSK